MSVGHCFISYSHADGLEFVTKLADELEGGHPFIKVWFEKREMVGSRDDWDDQLAKAIQQCKCLLFVMSKDSTAEHSNCKAEWTWALKYKKPVICLWIGNDAKDQFRLNSRQKLDFTSNFDAGLAKLRKTIAFLDSDEGKLEELKHRLADANRDLSRASEEDKGRIQAEIEDLNKQIEMQQSIVDNPEAAEKQTQDNIAAGLERERKPVKEVISKQLSKFINPPPGLAPNYFQDRSFETEQIAKFLNNDSQRLMTIVGRAGVGKTAMVCRLLKALERGELPDDLGEMKVDGIIYLSETGSHRVNFANVFADLSKLLPRETAKSLEGIYKNPQTSTGDKMRALLDAFPSGRVILLLDNFETLIDPESLSLRDGELSEALNALLGGQHHAVKAVITTRIAPRDLAISEPGRQHHLSLDEGLESPYAENVLREMDADRRVGLKSAPDALLKVAREKTRGYPRALEALYAILSVDRYTTLEELLEISLPEEVVQKLVGEAFNRLDPSAQKVMQALAVYNRPVSPAAIDYLLQPHLPSIDSAPVLNRLVNMHFARREAGRYYLHPVDREYAFTFIPVKKGFISKTTKSIKDSQVYKHNISFSTNYKSTENTKQMLEELKNMNLESLLKPSRTLSLGSVKALRTPADVKNTQLGAFTQNDLINRAADYFAQSRKPRMKWKKLEDLAAQLAEFDLRCAVSDFNSAASVLIEIDFDYLLLWGHYRLVIELHKKLQGKVSDKVLVRSSILNLGTAYAKVGKAQIAAKHYERLLELAKQDNDKPLMEATLGNLGNCYADLGNVQKAIGLYEKALVMAEEIGDRRGEGNHLGNLGIAHWTLGENEKSIKYFTKVLEIDIETGDQWSKALVFENTGNSYLSLSEHQNATENYQKAIQIADQIQYQTLQIGSRVGIAKAYLFQNDLVNARATIEAALQYDVPENNHNATALHGIIALRQGKGKPRKRLLPSPLHKRMKSLPRRPNIMMRWMRRGWRCVEKQRVESGE